ncbi:uncharacterized protein LOC142576161 [Dermacentor variabilis]|uniref:uncharacterized protein LOC142576161 n=1 Tax=Dermacentor variabilis TaxID=34621 RepID=UPI003F5AF99D
MALNRLKAGRGLQPVPEESAANGTTADAHPDAAAVPVNPLEQCVKSADGTFKNNGNDIADRRLRRWFSEDASAERHPPDDVSEKEYRIWFPRAEVSDEDVAGRASSDWRTFREYRYTECSQAGRLEKTLSVDEVFNSKGSPRTAAVNPPTLAFHCVSCSSSDEDKGGPLDVAEEGRCRMLSSTKSELYREHRSQLLSRLEDDDPTQWEASSLKTDKKPKLSEASGDTGSEKEARTSVCQTSSKKVAFEDENAKKGSANIPSSSEEGLASAPAPRSLPGNESSNREAVSAGLQDASLVSEDDDFDDSKCTYVKVDSVDSEVEDETGVTRETVIGAPSLDDLGYIAEEPEDEVDEITGDLGNRNSSAITTHEAAQSERSSMVSSTAEASHQAPLSSKLGVKEELSEADERGNDLQFNKVTLDRTVPFAADVDALAGGKSLKCHSDESKSSRVEEQYAKQISHHHNEPKNTVEAAPHHADLSDTETNESDTKSEESVITVKGDVIFLPSTNDQITDEVLADTVSRSANKKENGLDTRETFITGERHNPELISGKTVHIHVPSDTVNSQNILGEANGSITSFSNVTEELQKTSKNVSVLVSESSSNSGASQFGTSIVDNKSGQLTNDAIEFQETKYSHKDLSESLDRAARESGQVFTEANAWHQEEIGMLRESQELTKNAAAHILDISDRMEEMLDTASANVTNLLSSKCTFDSEMEANDEVGKRQHAGTIDERDQNDTQESMNESPKGASNKVSGLKEKDFLQFLKGGTLMDEVYELESVTCLSKADNVTENTQESVTVITDDSLLSRVFPSDKKSAADKREDQQQNSDVCQDVKNSAENNLQIGELLKQDTYQSAEMCFLKNTEVKTQNVFMCFTGGEEHTKETLKTVSSILSDSLPRKDILQHDVAHVVGGVKKGDKHLAEGGLKDPREDMREHFDDLALKNSHDFRDEGASHHHPAGMPNENVNTIQDTGVITEKGRVTDHVPMILPDDHHLFKAPEISSVQGQEGTGVTRESNDGLQIDSTEQGATQHCLAERAVPQENSLSSSIKTSMLKDVIALNRTDDATSFDDASLQDDNDQGFESLPCDQTLDQEDLNEKQVKDELYNVEKHLPADNNDNRGADELTALLDELVEHGKETPVSLQYDTGVQTTPTDATGQNNEPLFEHKLRSSASIDGCDKEGRAQNCAHGMRSDENAHPASAMSSENEVQVVPSVQTPESKSSERGSADPDEHKVAEIAGRNEDSEDISGAGMENTRKRSEYNIDLHSVNTSGWQETLQEKEEKASTQDETSGKFASEHSVNQATGDDNRIGKGNTETLEKEPIDIRVTIEASVKDGDARCEEFAMEKPANQSTSENEITEVKTGNLMSESLKSAAYHEESAQYETSETFLSNASVKKSTNENEIVKLKVESSEAMLRNIAVRDEEIMLHETSGEVVDGATTHVSSGDIDVTKLKTGRSVDEISETVCNEASGPNETSEQTESEAPISQSTADEVTVVKAMIPVNEISETAMPNEADVQSETLEDFSSEELVSQGSGKKDFGKIEEERSEDQLVSTEAGAQSKKSDEFASERSASHITDDQHITNEKADAPGSEFLEFFDELSAQIKASDALASEESVNMSESNILVTEVKAEASVSELPKVLMSTEASVHSKSEEFASGETVCQSTTDSDVTKVKADISISEVLENVVSTEASERTVTLEECASEASVNESMNEKISRVEPDTYVSESPEIALSTELSVERKTADQLTSEESVNLSTNENEVGKVNAEASVSEMPELLVSIEGKMHSTSEEFASGGTARPDTSDTEITIVKAETLFAEIPEIVVSDEASGGTETPEESASEALMNLTTDVGTKLVSGASVSDVPEVAVFVENKAENKTSGHLASDGSGNQNVNDEENTEVKTVTSASELPTLIASNETTDKSKISDELSSGEAVHHSAGDVAFTQVKEGTSASKASQITIGDVASIQSKTSAKFENEVPVNEITNENVTGGKADTSFEWPKIILSAEMSDRSKISDQLSSREAVHHSAGDVAFTQVKEGTSASKVSQITMADEASIQSKISAMFEKEVPVSETTNDSVTEAKADTSFEWPKIILSAEMTDQSKLSDELSDGEAVHHSASDVAFTQVKEGTSASSVSQITIGDEASIQSKISAMFEKEVPVGETTNGNVTEAKADTSFEWPKIILSAEMTDHSKISDELSNGEAVHHSASDVAFTQVKEGTSASKVSQITIGDEASIQSKISAMFEKEVLVSETTNGNVTQTKADTSFEWPKIKLSNETSVRSKSAEGFTSEESVNKGSCNEENTKADEEELGSEFPETIVPNEASVQVVSVETEFQSSSEYEALKVTAETSTSAIPEIIVSDEASIQTPEKVEDEALVNDSPCDDAIPEAKSEASASKLPSNEASLQSITSEEFASGESTCETKGDVEISTVKADVPISEMPEIAVSNEVTLQRKTYEELKSDAAVNENANDNEFTEAIAGASVIELPEVTVPNEASVGSEITGQLTSNGHVQQSNSDNENTEGKPEASDLPEVAESDKPSVQISEEFASEESVTRNSGGNDATEVTPGTSMNRPPEFDATRNHSDSEDLDKTSSDTSETRMECITKDNTTPCIVLDGVAAQGQREAAFDCTSLPSNMTKRFANADSYDEMTEDNETASTGAESADGELRGTARSDESIEGCSIEEVDKVMKDVIGNSLENTTKECVENNYSERAHALDEERHRSHEASAQDSTHEKFAKQHSVYQFADDEKNVSQDSISEDSALEGVPVEFREATDDRHTAELGNGSIGVSHILLEDTADVTSAASKNERSMHTSEPAKKQCEGTGGHNETLAEAADEGLGNVDLDSEEHLRLRTTGSESVESEVLHHEISPSQDVVEAKEPSTAEMYNTNIAGISLNSSLEQENRDNRSSLLAYAEEIVSTVLTKCVTYLEENDETLRRAELVGRNRYELNADTENAVKEKTISDDYKEELRIPFLHSDSTNRGSPGDAFEPIVSRQSAFEEDIPPADHQYSVTSRDANQAAVVLPVAAEDEINSNEALNYPAISEQHDQSFNMEAIDETITNSTVAELATSDEVFDNAKSDVPLNSAEDAGLLLITKERHDGDASDSASISEALTEDGASSEPEPHSSVSAVKSNQEVPDQAVEQADQSEEKLEEEERSAVARLLDEAGKDPSEGSETRRNFVESDSRDENSEPAHSVATTGRIIRLESKINEELFSDSAACVHTRRFERSASDVEARAGDDARESEEAENEATSNSFSESSATTVSTSTEDSAESVSEFSTKASEQASDAVSANEVNRDNSDTSDACHTDAKNVQNNKVNGTHSLHMPDSVADTSNNTAEGREESTSRRENHASVHGSDGQSGIPHDTEDGNGIGHQGWDLRKQTKKTTVPENHDMFSQEVRSEVAVHNGENDKSNEPCIDTNFNGSARPKDKDVSKHESSATADNDMDSLGALSTVYESSLEYVRSYTDEHISASDVNATVSGGYYAVGTTTISNISPLKNISVLGGVFENDEHSDEGKAELNSDESTVSAPSCPLQTDRSGGTGDASIQHVANTSDPEVASGFIPEETAGALGRHVDMTGLSAGKMSTITGEDRGTNDFEASNDWITLQETDQAKVAVEDHGDPIQPRKQLEGDQGGSQIDSGENVTQYIKNVSAIWDQPSLTANSLSEGYIKAGDTSSRENDTEDAVVSELPKTKIADAHEALHQVEQQALEEDEVATMDFSDEEERSLGDTGAHEHIVFVDVHDVPISRESGDTGNAEIEQEGAREQIVSSKTSGSAVTTTDSNGKRDASGTEDTNLVQLDPGASAQDVEAEAEGPSSTSTHVHAGSPHAGSLSEKLQPTVEALKTAVVVHEETKLEALECSEDLLHSVATEADFSSDIYEQASDGLDADAGTDEDKVEQPTTARPAESADVSSAYGDQRVPTEEYSGLDQEGAQNEIKERIEDEAVPHKRSSSDAVEDTIVPEHIQSPSNKSSTESEAGSEKQDVVANGDLKCAVEDFSRLISSDGNDIHATNRKSVEKGRIHDEAVITEASNENVVPEVTEDEGDQKSQPRKATGAKEGDKADNDNQEDSLKTDSSESFDLSAAGGEGVGESGSRNVKENTTHRVTEAVEQSERTEGEDGASSGDPVRSTRIFQRTVKRTESTRTVRRTRSFLPYTKWMKGEARQRARQEARDEDVAEPVEETLVAQQAFPAMSIPRRGLCPTSDCPDGNVCSVAVQAFPSVFDQGVQVDFDEHDCITRLVELQIAMNEQEEVRRQDMKAACELVEKLEAMQLSESLMRTQLRAMDAERREQSAREARLRDELTAWQETVQQQQLLLQQLKEDLDDTEDTLAAQRQEANRLREQMLVLQESCDSGLLMVDVLGRADKEVQTPDGGGQQPFSSSSPYKGIRLDNSSPVYLDQLSQHRRLSALVSSQLEATANRIAQLRREAAANRPRGSAIDEYVQDLAVGTDVKRSGAPPS